MKTDNDQNTGDSNYDAVSGSGTWETETRKNRRKYKKKEYGNAVTVQPKLRYKFSSMYKEDHGKAIFDIQFNHLVKDVNVFACVGSNRVTLYECLANGKLEMLQCYADVDSEENLYTCAWSYHHQTRKPLLAAAGLRGVIRILDISTFDCAKSFIGHANAINELKFHPVDSNLLLSASKDYTLRLWNIKTVVCVAIFGGVDGHRDQVLSADFNIMGGRIISGGMDHSLKLWIIDDEEMQTAIKKSYEFDADRAQENFQHVERQFADFTTRDVHQSYVDRVLWFGEFIISKACENNVTIWKPGSLKNLNPDAIKNDGTISIVHKLEVQLYDLWWVKFSMDPLRQMLALGNPRGKLFVWDLNVNSPDEIRSTVLTHPQSTATIRQTGFSKDKSILIAVSDDAAIWRWDAVSGV